MLVELALSGPSGAGLAALLDAEDHARAAQHRWYALRVPGSLTIYARTKIGGVHTSLHAFVLGRREGFEIDHIDGNGLNNTRANLRFVTHQVNIRAAHDRYRQAESDRLFDLWEALL